MVRMLELSTYLLRLYDFFITRPVMDMVKDKDKGFKWDTT